jgi:hypothetical protein
MNFLKIRPVLVKATSHSGRILLETIMILICNLIVKLFGAGIVDIATRYRLDGSGIESRWGARFSAPVQTGFEVHPAPYTMDTGSLSWG